VAVVATTAAVIVVIVVIVANAITNVQVKAEASVRHVESVASAPHAKARTIVAIQKT
jgi:hypothetical protein